MAIILSVASIWSLNATQNYHLKESEETLRDDFDRLIKNEVETAVALIDTIYNDSKKGLLSIEEAKKKAADLIRELRYGNDGYFWIDTYEGDNIVLYGNKDVEGTNRYELQDKKDNYIIKELIKQGINGGGYSDYYFPKEDSDTPLPKRAYSLAFEPYEWVIGTGNYTDDIDNLVNEMKQEFRVQFIRQLIIIIIITSVCFILSVIIGLIFSKKKLTKPIEAVTSFLHTLATGDFTQELPPEYFNLKDELGILIQSTENMRQSIRKILTRAEDVSKQVLVSAKDLAATSEQSSIVSDEITQSISDIAQGSLEQAQNTSYGSEKLKDLGYIIDEDGQLLNNLADVSDRIMVLINDGLIVLNDLSKKN